VVSSNGKKRKLTNQSSICDLAISPRTQGILERDGLVTIGDLVRFLQEGKTPCGHNNVYQFGRVAREECVGALAIAGFHEDVMPIYEALHKWQWKAAVEYWDNRCAVCGSDDWLVQDHWIPRRCEAFPGSEPTNIVPLCTACNVEKGNTGPMLWLVGKLGYIPAMRKMGQIVAYFEWWMDRHPPGE
jgi:hypothetical protein